MVKSQSNMNFGKELLNILVVFLMLKYACQLMYNFYNFLRKQENYFMFTVGHIAGHINLFSVG